MTVQPTIAFHNGDWVDRNSLSISIHDLGFRQGVTAVERLRTYGERPFQLPNHLKRWSTTLTTLHLANRIGDVDWCGVTDELLDRNRVFVSKEADVGITWLATPGDMAPSSMDTDAATMIGYVQRLPHRKTQQFLENGQPIVVTDVQQPPSESWSRQIKVRSRLHYYLADEKAKRVHEHASGILVDEDGSVTESSISNIAVIKNGKIESPPSDQVLPGVTQQFVEAIARDMGTPWTKRRLTAESLHEADAVLLMGTDHGLWWASQIDGGDRRRRNVGYEKLREQFDIRVRSTIGG